MGIIVPASPARAKHALSADSTLPASGHPPTTSFREAMADDLQDEDLQFMMDEDMTCGGADADCIEVSPPLEDDFVQDPKVVELQANASEQEALQMASSLPIAMPAFGSASVPSAGDRASLQHQVRSMSLM